MQPVNGAHTIFDYCFLFVLFVAVGMTAVFVTVIAPFTSMYKPLSSHQLNFIILILNLI